MCIGMTDGHDRDRVQRDIADRIVEGCRVRGWTLRRLAEEAGIAASLVGRYARAGGVTPSPGALHDLGSALGVSPAWLLTGEGEGPAEAA